MMSDLDFIFAVGVHLPDLPGGCFGLFPGKKDLFPVKRDGGIAGGEKIGGQCAGLSRLDGFDTVDLALVLIMA